jgi:hypothetical protein
VASGSFCPLPEQNPANLLRKYHKWPKNLAWVLCERIKGAGLKYETGGCKPWAIRN